MIADNIVILLFEYGMSYLLYTPKKHFTVRLLKSIKSVILKCTQWGRVIIMQDLRESEPLD